MRTLTTSKSIWVHFIHEQQQNLPLYSNLQGALTFEDVSSADLEAIVIRNRRIQLNWTLPRSLSPHELRPPSGKILLGLELFLDRWLLGVYSDGFVHLWDTLFIPVSDSSASFLPCATLSLGHKDWTSYAAIVDSQHATLILVLTRHSL